MTIILQSDWNTQYSSLVPKPFLTFQCCTLACNIEKLGVAWGLGYNIVREDKEVQPFWADPFSCFVPHGKRCHKSLGTPWQWGSQGPHCHRNNGDPMVKMGTPLQKGMTAAESEEYRQEVQCSYMEHIHGCSYIHKLLLHCISNIICLH